ncbi:hypothetical protein GQS52_22540 [Streptomyces sp. SCUT-3]|uniref:hypothetical protein n=1 Tax=Streptomyces sp. SCUT-3 TaxID=2684469 RepID=UPI0015FB0F73|nr:hypothetical protein [Streptomyces sp. SCUT-3]QMV24096.1 hypothetical protein GQS52_22540 [Streptomyces sp. SCUT-3]
MRRSAAVLAAALALALLPGATAVGDSPGASPGTAGPGPGPGTAAEAATTLPGATPAPGTASKTDTAPGAGKVPGAEATDSVSYIAEGLRENPVWISDQVPREVPRSAAPLLARAAERTGMPTYVVVTATDRLGAPLGGSFLDDLHDRLGRDGLYVRLSESGGEARVHGAGGPDGPDGLAAEAAMRAAETELPHDAGPVVLFQRFVEILASGRAVERAEAAEAKASRGWEPDWMYPSDDEMNDRSLFTGALATGVPLSVLLTVRLVRRRRGTLRPRSGRRTGLVLLAAASTAGAVTAGCWAVFGTPPPRPVAQPTGAELGARVERVVEGLARSPLYVDPETAEALAPGDRARLRERIAGMDVPVLVAAVPMQDADESAGDGEVLVHSLHGRIGRDAVYVVADTGSGTVDIVPFGVDRAGLGTFDLPDSFDGPGSSGSDDGLARVLDEVLQYVEDSPRGQSSVYYAPDPPLAPADEDAVQSLFAGDLTPGATVVGPLLAVSFLGVVAGVLFVADWLRGAPARGPFPSARNRPTTGLLRRTARKSTAALARLLAERPAGPGADAAAGAGEGEPAAARARRYHGLATALLEARGGSGSGGNGGADPVALVCAVVLAHAGKAALTAKGSAGADGSEGKKKRRYTPCRLNPLHGSAQGSRKTGTSSGEKRPVQVCAACASSLNTAPNATARLVLHLPCGPGGRLVPVQELPGPFAWSAGAAVRVGAVAQWAQERLGDAAPGSSEGPVAPAVDLSK